MRRFLPFFIIILVIIGAGVSGYFIYKAVKNSNSTVVSDKQSEEERKEKEANERRQQQDLLFEKLRAVFKQKATGTTFSVSIYDLKHDEYFGLNDTKPQHAASVSKVLTAVYTYYLAEKGKIDLSEPLGAYNVETQLKYMVNISNSVSWDLIDERVGRETQNKYAKSIGLKSVDLRLGKNMMSPKDATMLLVKLTKEELISQENRDKLFSYMQNTENEKFFSPGFPKGTIFYHKTGFYQNEAHDNAYVEHAKNPFVLTIFSVNIAAAGASGRGYALTVATTEVFNYFDELK